MKKRHFLILAFFVFMGILTGCTEQIPPELIGDASVTIEVFDDWVDLGVVSGDECTIDGVVETNVVGTYTITYTCDEVILTREVTVVDTEDPVISLTDGDLTIEFKSQYVDPGFQATDNYDGDLSASVIINGKVDSSIPGDYYITYTVTDTNDNSAVIVTRKVTVSEPTTNNPPYLVIVAPIELHLELNSNFSLPEAFCYDYEDGDISDAILVDGSVDIASMEGPYELIYSCTDSDDNTTTEYLQVHVEPGALNDPVIYINEYYVRYVEINTEWIPPILVGYDYEDGFITDSIVSEGTVDTTHLGQYIVKYTVTDSDGFRFDFHLYVNVVDPDTDTTPKLVVSGPQIQTVSLNRTYNPPYAWALDYMGNDITENIVVTGTIDTSVTGFQTLIFTVTDNENNSVSVTHYVAVTDWSEENKEPYMFQNGPSNITITLGEEYVDLGATCFDSEDGNLTDTIVMASNVDANRIGNYEVWYGCIDSGGIFIEGYREVHVVLPENAVDNIPYINLFEGIYIVIEVGSVWEDPGYIAYDYEDGIVTALVIVGGDTVDTQIPGVYEITYQILNDNDQVIVEVVRTVIVDS